jgi:sulfur relay (sulfurtransferase) complex TusBCD TusD component (DsrE family)
VVSSLNIVSSGGKTMRGSKNKIRDKKARHIVSLFLSQEKITLAQSKVDDKSNEIPALLELLEALKLSNCVVKVKSIKRDRLIF